MITIVLAEDHEVVRESFRAFLEAEPDFTVVGEAGSGPDAVQLVVSKQPDVLIVDLQLPGLFGTEVAWQVGRQAPETRVIVLSMYDSEPYVREALRNGAMAYVLKAARGAELKQAVRAVMQGRRYLSASLSERAIDAYLQQGTDEAFQPAYATLTRREREVFQLCAQGQTSRQIGEHLHISPRTVDKHRNNLMGKLGLHSQAELIQYAMSQGLLGPAEP